MSNTRFVKMSPPDSSSEAFVLPESVKGYEQLGWKVLDDEGVGPKDVQAVKVLSEGVATPATQPITEGEKPEEPRESVTVEPDLPQKKDSRNR